MSTHDQDDDYEVGYGKPPKSTQFKKGSSGNSKGRPKAARGIKASVNRELGTKITVRQGNREVKISKAEAAAKRLVASAIQGDMKAVSMLAAFDTDLSDQLDAADGYETVLPAEPVDYEILRHFFALESSEDGDVADEEAGDENS